MPSTFVTKEALPAETTPEELKELIRLRIKAGAIRCWQDGDQLLTEWNVIGEQD
jgi:hypothetical protein